jgi:hypothetical protein
MDQLALILEEYKVSKDSLKSVLTQMVSVSAPSVALPIVLLQLISNKDNVFPIHYLYYLILIIVNFLAAFMIYLNIQVYALEKHIASLEKRLNMKDVFRWESTIAREWYSARLIPMILTFCLIVPPLLILFFIYYQLSSKIQEGLLFYIVLIINVVYLSISGFCYIVIIRRIKGKIG